MATEATQFDKVITFFDREFDRVQRKLQAGFLDSYRERVQLSQQINEALHLLSPYVRSEWRARDLVRKGEDLKRDLLSVRDILKKKRPRLI
jgi:hypothetical protein